HAEELMVLAELLDQAALALFIGDEVLDEVEQALRRADAENGDLEPGGGRLVLALGLLPIDKMLVGRMGRADLGLHPVRDEDRGVVGEKRRNVAAVAADVALEGVPDILARAFQLDEQQ